MPLLTPALLRESSFPDADGQTYRPVLLPVLTPAEIAEVARPFPAGWLAPQLLKRRAITQGENGYGLEEVTVDSIGQLGFAELAGRTILRICGRGGGSG
ncbi:hypothetical protein [Hymenobacter rubripertinctus]|uniref:Uncharacterized protein n=1 Tax=Hymenobacter rubripertinctus TaxID=2029981 RepID=A0A418QNJ5_9BACT|nr:hypothetical protein [Hymenobacter rubripertinctus]RIY06734.1 hypothetical protein D0T11_17955 [Hymenobacter rubripertinctus]